MNFDSAIKTSYRDEGYTVIRGLLSSDELRPVRERLMELRGGKHDWPANHFQILDPTKYQNAGGGFIPAGVQQPASREPVFETIADHRNLREAMEFLLEGEVVRYTDQALIKDPKIGFESFFHQDSKYWHLGPEKGCNAWIALDEVGKDASALAMMPKSHKIWEIVPHEEYFDELTLHSAVTGEPFRRHRIPFDRIDFSKEVLLPMAPGDAAFFSNYTWHRAEPNRSDSFKMAYAIAYQLTEPV